MHKITKGLKKKKKGKKSKHKDEELFKPEELEAYRKAHTQQQPEAAETQQAPTSNEEWKKFNALTSGIDDILKKTQGDLDRIKSTSFFQRVPPPSEVKEKERAAQAEAAQTAVQPEPPPLSAAEAAIVEVSESESEYEDEDDIFDTTYIDAVAAGEIKLAYIPESPTEQPEGDDPFDTSIAERAILGPSVDKRGKKLVPIGAAVEILTGRVQAPTCVPTKRPSPRRQIFKERDLLLGSFDETGGICNEGITDDNSPENKPTLLDDDAPAILSNEPIDLSKSLHLVALQQQPQEDQTKSCNEFVKQFEDDDDDEFALLAAESINKKPSGPPAIQPTVTAPIPKVDDSSWGAFNQERTEEDAFIVQDDPFDTTFAENILPGKAELKLIEKEILDVDFSARGNEILSDVHQRVSIHITNPTGQRESISSLDRVSESELCAIKPIHRDLLGGSSTDLTQLGDQPLQPKDTVDENYIEYCDPFDTSLVDSVKPGQTELKFLEKELLGDILSDDEFDPRAGDVLTSQARKVSFELPLDSNQGLVNEGKVPKPLTPYYVRDNSIPEEEEIDPFDTSFVSGSAPGKAELKLIEKELFKSGTDLSDQDFDPRNEQTVAVAKVVQTIKEISDPNFVKPTDLALPKKEQIDLLGADNDVASKVLTPAGPVSTFDDLADPFDTSIASNILPGKTELKLLENELFRTTEKPLLHSVRTVEKRKDIFDDVAEAVNVKALTPCSGASLNFEDDDIDPFDTSIASNIGPGRTELKLLESELI